MKSVRSKKLTIVAATSMTIFSLAAVFAACIAWFSSNINTGANGAAMNVQLFDQRFKQMTLHKYLGEYTVNQTTYYRFNKDPSGRFTYSYNSEETAYESLEEPEEGEEDKSAFMGEYSLTAPRHPFLALIEFSRTYNTNTGDDSILIKAETENPFICATDDEGDFLLGLDYDSNPLSSVIKYSSNSYASLESYEGTYSTYDTYNFQAPNSWDHFVQIGQDNEGNYTYDNATGWSNEKTIINVSGGAALYVTIIFDYYDEALGYIYNKYLGDEVLEQESVPFVCDWKLII